MLASINKQIQINTPAIIFGALIGIGLWITIASLGVALSINIEFNDNKLPSYTVLIVIAIAAIIILTASFFLAGFITSKIAHQQSRLDSVIHSVSSWAVMAILLVILLSTAMAAVSMRSAVNKISSPVIVTEMKLLEGKAITTMKDAPDKGDTLTLEEKKSNKIFKVSWWISFLSLLFGLGASVIAGLMGCNKISIAEINRESCEKD